MVQQYHDRIIEACLKSGVETIPHSTSPGTKVVPGWNEHVEPLKQKALLWHFIWKSNNCPREGTIALIRRQTRAKYHLALKSVKKNKDNICAQRLAESICGDSSRDFWKEIKKIKQSKNSKSHCIDGKYTSNGIANHFADKYDILYNSVSYDKNEMDELKCNINSLIESKYSNDGSSVDLSWVTVDKIMSAVRCLKLGKHDGDTGYYSDHITHACNSLYVHLSLLFKTMLTHGCAPSKDRKSVV